MMMMKMTVIQIVHLMTTPGNSCQIFSLHYALIEVFKKNHYYIQYSVCVLSSHILYNEKIYIALQILAPLAHVPLSAKIDSVPMIYFQVTQQKRQ